MKKFLTLLLSLLLLCGFAGCTKTPDQDPTPKPKPDPKPAPVAEKLESSVGSSDTIAKALEKFIADVPDWNAFKMFYDEEAMTVEYGAYDSTDIYERNYEKYAERGVMPNVYVLVRFADGKETGEIEKLYALIPYENIQNVKEEDVEGIIAFQNLLLKAIFPDLNDRQIAKLVDRLSLTTADGYQAYAKGQADASEFAETKTDVFPKGSDTAYSLSTSYDKDYKSILLSFEK